MNENKKGYWFYSTIVVVLFVCLFAFLGYLIYDLVVKLADKDFSNNTVIQALITLVITVFIGGYFSKWLERNNSKKIEVFKLQRDISLNIVDLSTALMYHPDNENIKQLLIAESSKVKLYFDDDTLKILNKFITEDDKKANYSVLIDSLKKAIK